MYIESSYKNLNIIDKSKQVLINLKVLCRSDLCSPFLHSLRSFSAWFMKWIFSLNFSAESARLLAES